MLDRDIELRDMELRANIELEAELSIVDFSLEYIFDFLDWNGLSRSANGLARRPFNTVLIVFSTSWW